MKVEYEDGQRVLKLDDRHRRGRDEIEAEQRAMLALVRALGGAPEPGMGTAAAAAAL